MIADGRVYLRTFDEKDIDILCKWKNDAEVLKYESSNPYLLMTKDNIRNSYLSNGSNTNYAICLKEDNKLIGEVSYWYPNFLNKSTVEVGIAIWDKRYRNGYGVDALLAIGKIIFNNIEIHRVTFCISSHNFYSKQPIEKILKKEAMIKNDRYMEGNYYDTYMFGCLRTDYERIKDMLLFKGDN